MTKSFIPPAVPLITVDPYFNIWSASDQLHESETKHWTGKTQGMVGLAKIDGKVWRFMGGKDRRSDFKSIDAPAMTQTGLVVRPLSTIYTFEAGGLVLKVDFTTPLLPDDLDILSRPASYITFEAASSDGKPHQVEIYCDVTGELCVDQPLQEVEAFRSLLGDGTQVVSMGTVKQPVLKRSGDDLRIDWGYVCLAIPASGAADQSGRDNIVKANTVIADTGLRDRYAESGQFDEKDDTDFPRDLLDKMPILAGRLDFGTVEAQAKRHFLIVVYDDILSIEYFGDQLPGYWRRDGGTFEQMLQSAVVEYTDLMQRCARFDEQMVSEATASGGEKYADILSVAYRQAVAAHKLVADGEGNAIFLSKENFSNGCIGTVDVSYPSIPLFLLYNPELVKGMLRPIFRYAASDAWPYPFAPHDVGRYPLANGQAYGMAIERQMPIEECGNMLIMMAAVCQAEGNADFASQHWELLTLWVDYLRENGLDPGNQLCTDDFGGHLAHNANLSIKAIVAIGSYGLLCGMRGDEAGKRQCLEEAARMAREWESMAREDDHYRLAFDAPGTWSLKYNLVWDTLLGLHIFPENIRRKEVAYYLSKRNIYGTPLDNRQTYTKSDWLLWAATLADDRNDFDQLVEPLWLFLKETRTRVPFTDWYYTIDGRMTGFVNRSVVGGLYIKILADRLLGKTK